MNTIAIVSTAFSRNDAAALRGPAREYLSCRLSEEEYGIDFQCVQEIGRYSQTSTVDRLNRRGDIVSIMDLRTCIGVEARFDTDTAEIVLNLAGQVAGVVVDSVSDVVELAPSQIRPASDFNGFVDARYITGIGSIRRDTQERTLILLDIEKLLAEFKTLQAGRTVQ